MAIKKNEKNEGLENSAIFLLSLGEDVAAEVLKHLSPKHVQKIGSIMAQIKTYDSELLNDLYKNFEERFRTNSTISLDSADFIKRVLNKALGDEKASLIIDRILQTGDTSGIESLKWMDAKNVAELIKNEHPQIIAAILVHLERDQAASVLSYFTEERKQGDVMMRIATLDGINPIALKELNDTLGKILLGGKDQLKKSTLGGVRTAAEILNFASGTTEQIVMDALKTQDPDMAQKIQDEMFVFDNILDIDNRGIQAVLREVQSESLILSLKGASQDIRNKILSNMSSRAAEALREDLESRGPVKLSDVEKEQKEILKIVRRLAEEGTIQLSGKGDDAYV